MILYAVQWHSAPLPPHADENDLDWTTWRGHDDYAAEQDAEEAAREFDAAFDGAYVHRVVARQVEGPSVARARHSDVVSRAQTSGHDAEAASAQVGGRVRRG